MKVYKDTMILTTPRILSGVTATLATVDISHKYHPGMQPKLKVWPNWEWQRPHGATVTTDGVTYPNMDSTGGNTGCEKGFTLVMGIEITPDGQLWVLDSGIAENFESSGPVVYCPPSVSVFDFEKKELLTRYFLPNSVSPYGTNFLNDIVVDAVKGVAYISDNSGGAILFVDPFTKTGTRLAGPTTVAEKRASNLVVGGNRFASQNPVNSIALHPDGQWVYYASNSGFTVHMISTAVMADLDPNLTPEQRDAKSLIVGEKPTTSASMYFGKNATLWFGGNTMDALLGWTDGRGLLTNTWFTAFQDHEEMRFTDNLATSVPKGWKKHNPEASDLWWEANDLFTWLNFRADKRWKVNFWKAPIDTGSYQEAIKEGLSLGDLPVTYVPTSDGCKNGFCREECKDHIFEETGMCWSDCEHQCDKNCC